MKPSVPYFHPDTNLLYGGLRTDPDILLKVEPASEDRAISFYAFELTRAKMLLRRKWLLIS
jgi:hypothetical protein